jgi:hypothetical protein
MAGPNAAASAALDDAVLHPCYVAYLDFLGDPVRVTTAPFPVTFSGSGDGDLDGHTFDALTPELVKITEVHHQEQGSETVTATLAGLIGVNTDLLNVIGDRTKWQGRAARLWLMLLATDGSFARIGNIWPYYTGTMLRAGIKGASDNQIVEVQIESYLANFAEPSNRTYLDQQAYDSGDLSAAAAIAIANGKNGAGLSDSAGQFGISGNSLGALWWNRRS